MDNGQYGMNGAQQTNGMGGMPPVQPIQPATPQYGNPGMPMVQQVHTPVTPKKDVSGLVKTIVIILLALVAVTFIGLFIWMMMEKDAAETDVNGQIAVAVAEAKDEQAMELENEFLEREKYPYKTFSGPVDYGQLTFEYPKTWSVYIEKAATTGGDFNAYFNPNQVDAVGKDTINALRVTIRDKSFDDVVPEYQRATERKNAELSMESVTIGKDSNVIANRYTGTIPGTELSGYIVIFKIRDKTVILQTDSVLFKDDFDKLLGTVVFNE